MAAAITWAPCSKTYYVKKQPNKIKIGKFYQKLADFSLCNYFFALSASSISLLKLSGFSISLGNSWSIIWLANCSFWGVFCWPTASDAVFFAVLICSFSTASSNVRKKGSWKMKLGCGGQSCHNGFLAEISSGDRPVLSVFHEIRCHQANIGTFIRKDSDHAGTSPNFRVCEKNSVNKILLWLQNTMDSGRRIVLSEQFEGHKAVETDIVQSLEHLRFIKCISVALSIA